MDGVAHPAAATADGRRRRDQAAALGLRRVTYLRVVVSGSGVAAEAVGVGHRLPVTRRVSLAMAATLAAGGVPTAVLHAPAEPVGAGPGVG